MILTGELPAGSRITQDEVARRLGVSTTPVREALSRLAAEGFIEGSPNRSFRVNALTPDDTRDVYWLIATLTGELAYRACLNRDDELIANIREDDARYMAAVAAHDSEAVSEANWQFHRRINVAADAPKILLTLNGALRFLPDNFYELAPEWMDDPASQHGEIIDAFEKGDPELARRVVAEHMRWAGEKLVEHYRANGLWF
jgi:DNA-binding GntR family transcriptional regulator